MKPILYAANATNFFNLGLGVLNDAYSCLVHEKRNGAFYLEMEYPVEGALFKELQNNRLIKADAGHELTDQRFKIKKITKPIDGKVKIYAEHISYKAAELALKPHVNIRNVTAQQALQQWQNNFIDDDKPFTLSSNITTVNSTSWSIREVENPRQALGGVQGSILDVWGGEYKFDNYHISLFRERGVRANALIAYGRNITDFEQEEDITSVYTSVYPYAVYTDEDGVERLVTIPEYIVDSRHVDKYPNRMVLPIDFTAEFGSEETPTVQRLRSMAQSYIESNEIGIPKVSIRLTHVDLSKTLDYKQYKGLEKVNLCDNVLVKFLKIGVDTTAKVIGIIWNVLLERYEELEIGESRSSLSSRLNAIDQEARQARKEASDARNFSSVAANGINMVFFGPDEPTATKVGDRWFEENGEYTISRVWDGVIWRVVNDPRITDQNAREIAEAQEGIQEAKDSADTANHQINDAINAAGFSTLADLTADIQSISNRADANAQTALSSANNAVGLAQDASSLATTLSGQVSDYEITVDGFTQTVNNYTDQVAQFTSDVNGLNSTVASYETQVDEFGNTVSTYATQVSQFENTVSGLNSTVSNYRSDVQGYQAQVSTLTNTVDGFNATVQRVEGDYSSLSGTVQALGSSIGVVEGQITNKVWQTDIRSAVDGIEIGARNLARGTINSNFLIGANISNQTKTMYNRVSSEPLEADTDYVLSFKYAISNSSNPSGTFRIQGSNPYPGLLPLTSIASLGERGYLSAVFRLSSERTTFAGFNFRFDNFTSGARFEVSEFKVEKGTKATDWTPAPEDTLQLISNVETEWKQTAQGFEQSITRVETDLNGKASLVAFNTLTNTVNGTVQRIGNAEGNITQIEANVSGLQTTVANKADQSQITQLSNAINLKVSTTDVEALIQADKRILDTRDDNRSPEWYQTNYPRQTVSEFKTRVAMGISSGETYGILETIVPWVNSTGGSIKQTFYQNNRTYIRQGIASGTVWGAWEEIPHKSYVDSQITVLQNAINLRVREGDVMSQINIEAGRTLIDTDRLYLSANTTVFGGSAFIPNAAIESLSADKLTAGTIDAAQVNVIGLNVSDISGLNAEFVGTQWNSIGRQITISAENGIQSIGTNGDAVRFTQGEIEFQRGAQGRHLNYNPEGLILTPFATNTGTSLNTALIFNGITRGAHQYIDFNGGVDTGGNDRARIEHVSGILRLRHPNNGRIIVYNRSMDTDAGSIDAYALSTRSSRDDVITMVHNRLQTPRNNTRDIYIAPNGLGKVRVANNNRDYYPIRAIDFENASSRELKTNIETFTGNALDVINDLTVVEYEMKRNVREGVYDKQLGLISEDSLAVASSDGESILSYKVDAYLIKGMQELSVREANTNLLASDAIIQVEELKKKVKCLEQKLEEIA